MRPIAQRCVSQIAIERVVEATEHRVIANTMGIENIEKLELSDDGPIAGELDDDVADDRSPLRRCVRVGVAGREIVHHAKFRTQTQKIAGRQFDHFVMKAVDSHRCTTRHDFFRCTRRVPPLYDIAEQIDFGQSPHLSGWTVCIEDIAVA